MKPIATVHWTHEGKECSRSFYRMDWLESHVRSLINSNTVFVTCLTSVHKPLPYVANKNGDLSLDNIKVI